MHEIKVKYALETRYSTDSNSGYNLSRIDMHLAIGQMTKISCTDGGYQPSSDVSCLHSWYGGYQVATVEGPRYDGGYQVASCGIARVEGQGGGASK